MVEGVAQPRIVVLGSVRNCGRTLEKSVKSIIEGVLPGAIVKWYLVESDSSDNTVSVLTRLRRTVNEFEFTSYGPLQKTIPNRVNRIAFCRQAAKDRILELGDGFDYVLVADFDGILGPLRPGAISDSIARYPNADVITANSTGPYYDIFALRKMGWVDFDYRWHESELIALGHSRLAAKYKAMISKMIKIKRRESPIRVDSAFGGLAIYRSEVFAKTSYLPATSDECEHVGLNRTIASNGGEIWIDPQLQVAAELRHFFPALVVFRPFWWCVVTFDFVARRVRERMRRK